MSVNLPEGHWVFMRNVPYEATAEELSGFLCQHGLPIGPDRISLRRFDGHVTTALISVPHEVTAMLVDWALNGDELRGRVMTPAGWTR